jgi:GT2 family glycosyltransferase
MLVRREALDAAGAFSEAYFFGGEDLELCFRVRQTGKRIVYVHDWRITHFGGQSSSQASATIVVDAMLSYGMYFSRCRGRVQGLLFRAIVLLFWIPSRLTLSAVRLLTGQASRTQFRQRWRNVRGLIAWRSLR